MSERRLLVTGATGLIGKELAAPLSAAGFEVHAITIDATNPDNGFVWEKGSLFEGAFVADVMARVKPTHLLNLAWATTGDYLVNPVNYAFLTAGLQLARAFVKNGGRRAVFAGTCFEYRLGGPAPIREDDPLDAGKNAYTFCKDKLHAIAERLFAEAGVSFGYGRIFYVYGRRENETRLGGALLAKLSRGERVTIAGGDLVRDYIYAKDIAGAFSALVDSEVKGSVNVCTGKPTTLGAFARAYARALGRENLLDWAPAPATQPPVIQGDNTRLTQEVGYVPRYSPDAAVADILHDAR